MDLLQNALGAPERIPPTNPAPMGAVAPLGAHFDPSIAPPLSLLEKTQSPGTDSFMLHYSTFLPPFNRVQPGHKAACFADILSLSEAERPLLVVGVMRNNVPELTPLWGAAQHLDPTYNWTTAHDAHVVFCKDNIVQGNLPTLACFDCNWLVTKPLELLKEDDFLLKLAASAPGASAITELAKDNFEDLYVAQAAVLPSCLVPDLLRLP
jgi:hypothetical protein